MTEEFKWLPEAEPSGEVVLRVRSNQFGDGYAQTGKDGINSKVQSWPLSFIGNKSRIAEIAAFLDLHGGATAFMWRTPLGELGLYKASKYNPQPVGRVYRLTVTFQQTFQP